ncbi:PAS domain S-box protein [Ectothiorhodospiraceae bacterium 2226]|nr:PAS domain S-box protein [Ectothiorhodospiraceae bacterium 2226]
MTQSPTRAGRGAGHAAIITAELGRRRARTPDYAAESRALGMLAEELGSDAQTFLQKLVDTTLELCGADAAAISLTTPGGPRSHWHAIAGAFALPGEGVPLDALHEHGIGLDDSVVLLDQPACLSAALATAPPIGEALLAPFHADGQPAGLLWALNHAGGRFDAEHARLAGSLARFALAGYRFQQALEIERARSTKLRESQAELLAQARARERAEQVLVTEITHRQRLQEAATRVDPDGDVHALYAEILAAAIAVTHADMGSLQLIEPTTGDLVLLHSQGFDTTAVAFFERARVRADDCRTALENGRRVIITNLEAQPLGDSATQHMLREAGVLAVQATPLISRAGRTLGLISTHWRQAHTPSEQELHLLDVLARQAADLIERHRADAALRESEARFRAIVNHSDIGIAQADPRGRIAYANDCFCALTGRSRQTLLQGLLVQDLLHPKDRERSAELMLSLHAGGQAFSTERRYRRPDGTDIWVMDTVTPVLDEAGVFNGITIATLDITQRRQAEEQRRSSEARYRQLFESIDEGLCIIEVLFDERGQAHDYRFLEVNPAFVRRTGLKHAVGRRVRELMRDQELDWFEVFGRVARTGKAERFVQEASQIERYYDVYAFRIDAPAQHRVAILFQDITERLRRERNQAFLARVSADFTRLTHPEEILHAAGERIGRYLGVTGVAFSEIDAEGTHATVIYGRGASRPCTQRGYRLTDLMSQAYLKALRAGSPVAVDDVIRDPGTQPYADAYGAHAIRAQLHAPYRSAGRWKFLLTVQRDKPYRWSPHEVDLLHNLSERVWLRLERARAEDAMRASEARYRSLFHSIDEGFCVMEVLFDAEDHPVDYRWLEVNPSFERQTGLRDAVGKTARELVPDLDASWFEIYGKVARSGESVRFENHAPAMGRWFDVYAFRIGNPEERRVALLFKDITADKEAEAALRESEARFRRMADTAPAMLWLTDTSDDCAFVSRGWSEFTGQSFEQALGAGWMEAVHPDDQTRARASFLKAFQRREAFSLDYRLRHAGGGYRWCIDTGRPRYDENGEWCGFIGSVIDVHERKQAEEALRAADRRKDEFLATLAHELRNPLAPLRNSLDILHLRGEANDPLHEMMQRQVSHLTRLVDDLLEVSRITRGRIELRKERVELATIVRSAIEGARPAIEEGKHRLHVAVPSAPIVLKADAVRLAQVLGNLLNNAAKYTDPEGDIWLEARHAEGEMLISVRDTGIGLPPDQLATIFEMFTQVEHSAARTRGGLGIGLSLVRSLVEMHGGHVEAHSPGLGQGSEFVVHLPLPGDDAGDQEAPESQTSHGPLESSHRVVVADDNHDAADSLAALLEIMGLQPRVAYDGPGALKACDDYRPAVVLLDIGMPGMDGYEVARRLRANPRMEGVTLIALTGWGQAEDRRRTREAGFDHHLLKPVNLDALREVLEAL